MNKVIKEVFIDRYGNSKLKEIFNSNIFWIGLFIKVVLGFTLASNFLTDLFIPFADYYVKSGFANPYEHFTNIDKSDAFPYSALMLYIFSIPRVIFSVFTDWGSISHLTIFLARLPILLSDFLILVFLTRLIKQHIKKILIYYWLSPILIYINYIHGQLDVIPVCILFVSLYFLFKRKYKYSSLFLGLAIAAKTSMVIVFPFYFIYLVYSKTITIRQLLLNLTISIFSFLLINLPYLFSSEFIQMVFNNKKQIKIFDFSYNFLDGHILYFLPFAYLFLFIMAVNLKGFSKDVYMMFLGFSFGIIALMVSPMQGWYYWIIPFFIYFHAKRSNSKSLSLVLFLGLQLAYFIYFLLIENSDYLEVFQVITPTLATTPNAYQVLQSIGVEANKISNLSFTLLQAMLLANCIFIYRSGIKSYASYKIFSNTFLLGICGDSGAGKTTISSSIESIFKSRNTTIIHGDDMHKWERGNNNWNNLTHLNPKSNFLHDEISYLKAIKNKETINRVSYDHDTGRFTEEKEFKPSNLVIFEGLHSFYLKQMRDLYDLKIFVNPSENLRKYWKVNRDTKKRGYSEDKILKELDSREEDSEKFIKSQLKYADIIIGLTTNEKLNNKNDESDILLRVTVNNSFYLEPLFNELAQVTSVESKHEYEGEDKQFIEMYGTISIQEIDSIAYKLSLNSELEDLGISHPSWDKNYFGLIQLFISYCVMKNFEIEKNK